MQSIGKESIMTKKATSKSAQMVEMYNKGMEIKDIATKMGVRYNFVYNVVSNHCRVNDIELRTSKRTGDKKEQVLAMLADGKTPTEISKELKTNINYVYKIRKETEATA